MAEPHIYAMIPTSFLFLSLLETVVLRNGEMFSDLRWQISEKCAISPIRKSSHNDWTVSWVDGQREYSQFSPVVMVMSAVRICLSHGDRELPHSVASLACHIVVPSWVRIDEWRARVGAQCPGHATAHTLPHAYGIWRRLLCYRCMTFAILVVVCYSKNVGCSPKTCATTYWDSNRRDNMLKHVAYVTGINQFGPLSKKLMSLCMLFVHLLVIVSPNTRVYTSRLLV